MRLRQTGQSKKWRVAVFIAVVGLHVLTGLLIIATGTIRIERLRALESPVALLRLSPDRPPQPAASSTTLQHNVKRREGAQDIDRPPDVARPEPEPSNAITLPLDLRADADSVARRQAEMERNERRRRNLAGPSDSQLDWWRSNKPLIRDYRQFGDDERAEGGELITWANDKCYYTTHGLTTFGMPQTSMVCKDPPKPETDLFKDMRKKLDDGAKGSAP